MPRLEIEPLAGKALFVKVAPDVDALMKSLPNRSESLKWVITEAAEKKLLNEEFKAS
ncbi:MAG: hypothetical protein KME35_03595 [Aphanocapsa sp. GSE-SYN-MK-11-07L]|jgi:hypothetical protein|nr:hypothetical protein [Aphanocapsa sp. GSE-SYN-MK-11-07L]